MYGIHPVLECLRLAPQRVRQVLVVSRHSRLAEVAVRAEAAGVHVRECSRLELSRLAGSGRHQGCAALVEPYPYVPLERVLARRGCGPMVVVDGITDPRNLGAILRVAAAVDAAGVVLPTHRAVGVTPAAEKASAGAAAAVPVCRTPNVARVVRLLQREGVWVAGLVAHGGSCLFDTPLPRPIAVVVGGEPGLRPLVARSCDVRVTIPVRRIESLNVSVALAVALYEILRRGDRGHTP